eukprot:scaffold5608_cov43-Phaeocystis_antarctica.AAC.3
MRPQPAAHCNHELVAAAASRLSREHVVGLGCIARIDEQAFRPELARDLLERQRCTRDASAAFARQAGRALRIAKVLPKSLPVEDHVVLNPFVEEQAAAELRGEVCRYESPPPVTRAIVARGRDTPVASHSGFRATRGPAADPDADRGGQEHLRKEESDMNGGPRQPERPLWAGVGFHRDRIATAQRPPARPQPGGGGRRVGSDGIMTDGCATRGLGRRGSQPREPPVVHLSPLPVAVP